MLSKWSTYALESCHSSPWHSAMPRGPVLRALFGWLSLEELNVMVSLRDRGANMELDGVPISLVHLPYLTGSLIGATGRLGGS